MSCGFCVSVVAGRRRQGAKTMARLLGVILLMCSCCATLREEERRLGEREGGREGRREGGRKGRRENVGGSRVGSPP